MVNFIELNPWYFHPPQHLWMSFSSTTVTTTNRLGSQHGNSLKKCPLSDSKPGTDGRCVLFLVVGVFWCQLGQLSLVSHNRRLKSDDDLVSYWLIPPRPLPGPLFNLQPPTGWNPSLPPAIPPSLPPSLPHSVLLFSLHRNTSLLLFVKKERHGDKEWIFHFVYFQIHKLLWRSDHSPKSLSVGVEGGVE